MRQIIIKHNTIKSRKFPHISIKKNARILKSQRLKEIVESVKVCLKETMKD